MLIEFPEGVVQLDKRPVIEDFKLNMAPNNQLRCKFIAIKEDETKIPFDIVLFHYKFRFSPPQRIDLDLRGREMNSKKGINAVLSYSVLSKKWTVKGDIAGRNIDMSTAGFDGIWTLINDIFLK